MAATVLLLLLTTATARAEERVPLRVARLSISLQGSMMPSERTIDILETKLDRAMHVPLNGVLHTVEYLSESECEKALREVLAEMGTEQRKIRLQDAMEPWARRLRADVAICPVLTDYYEYVGYGWGWNGYTYMNSYARIVLYGYNGQSGQPFRKAFSRSYRGDSSGWGNASVLAQECMDHVIDEAKLREMIFGKSGNLSASGRSLEKNVE